MRFVRRLPLILSLLVVPAFGVACSGGDSGGSSAQFGAGEYGGLLTSGSETGVLEVKVGGTAGSSTTSLRTQADTASTMTVTGTITFSGGSGTVSLTGTFDPATNSLSLSGTTTNGSYSLSGTASGGALAGTYTSPNGSGSFSLVSAAGGSVSLYCGTYDGDASGVWNLAVGTDGNAVGAHCDTSSCGALLGHVSGSSVSLDPQDTDGVTATGSASGDAMSGTWQGGGASGTWTGSKGSCGG